METGFMDRDGSMLCVGEKIKVPDNPDICPYDIGVIKYLPENDLSYPHCDFIFEGQLSRRGLNFFESHEIKKIKGEKT